MLAPSEETAMDSTAMPENQIRYLREKARQLRQVAEDYKTGLSQQLLDLANEFDAKAAEIESGIGRAPPATN
jgi:hypothetical protein